MKLWVDDLRNPPDETWTVAQTSDEAIVELARSGIAEQSWDVKGELPRVSVGRTAECARPLGGKEENPAHEGRGE